MLIIHYDLIDETKLPLTSTFIDPYDSTEYRPKKGQTLTDFMSLISQDRAKKNFPNIHEEQFKAFVIESLRASIHPQERDTYFVGKGKLPQFSQVVSFARALASEIHQGSVLSVAKRQQRASKCLASCPFHRNNGYTKSFISKAATALSNLVTVGLKDVATFPDEAKLGNCGACGCPLRSKIKFSIKSAIASLQPHQLQDIVTKIGPDSFSKCWMLEEATKDPIQNKLLLKKLEATENQIGVKFYNKHKETLISKLKRVSDTSSNNGQKT